MKGGLRVAQNCTSVKQLALPIRRSFVWLGLMGGKKFSTQNYGNACSLYFVRLGVSSMIRDILSSLLVVIGMAFAHLNW